MSKHFTENMYPGAEDQCGERVTRKVFEVVCEYCKGDSKEITTEIQYVTADDNSLSTVAEYFTRHCYEYDKELMSVKEVITIVQNIEVDTNTWRE